MRHHEPAAATADLYPDTLQMHSCRHPSLSLLAAFLVTVSASASAVAQSASFNRWFAMGVAVTHLQTVADSTEVRSGRAGLRVSTNVDPTGFADAGTGVSAAAYTGRRIEVSTAPQAAALGGQSAAVCVCADSGEKLIAFATTQDRRYVGGNLDWTSVTVDLDVANGASSIGLGALSLGRGRLWIDDVKLAVISRPHSPGSSESGSVGSVQRASVLGLRSPHILIGVARVAASSTRRGLTATRREPLPPLTARALDNIIAFTRLVGYVRFWYPGSVALMTNWNEFTVHGMRVVENVPTADSLIIALRALFARVAPTVDLYRNGAAPPHSRHTDSVGRNGSVVFWEHCGFGVPDPPAGLPRASYHSSLRRVSASAGRLPSDVTVTDCGPSRTMPVPSPDTAFVAQLGAGMSASVPLALSEEAVPDSLTATASAGSTWQPTPATERFDLDDRTTRLADVALLWMVPQHFYPYFDVVHTDWPAALRTALNEAALDSDATAFDGTLQRLIAALHDGHGNVLRTTVVQAAPDVLLGWVENRIVVLAVGDSARALGVHIGDEIVAVDGRSAMAKLRDAEARTSGATTQWVRHAALSKVLLGIPGTVAVLRLRDPLQANSPLRDVRLSRVLQQPPAEPRPDKVAELQPGIFYVDLSRVTDRDVAQAMPRLEAARGIVFDMRGYPSRGLNTPALLAHLSDSTIYSARFELPLVLRPDHTLMRYADVGWVIAPLLPRLPAKVVFLTGAGAVSYAESTMGVVEENHLGPIVGETTAGTNGAIDPFALPGGYSVIWTGMRVEKRNGTPHHGVGIHPTIPVSPTLEGLRDGTDEVLARALKVVSGRVAP